MKIENGNVSFLILFDILYPKIYVTSPKNYFLKKIFLREGWMSFEENIDYIPL